jgi:hypothetical protein
MPRLLLDLTAEERRVAAEALDQVAEDWRKGDTPEDADTARTAWAKLVGTLTLDDGDLALIDEALDYFAEDLTYRADQGKDYPSEEDQAEVRDRAGAADGLRARLAGTASP